MSSLSKINRDINQVLNLIRISNNSLFDKPKFIKNTLCFDKRFFVKEVEMSKAEKKVIKLMMENE